jgi:hypothetical protein
MRAVRASTRSGGCAPAGGVLAHRLGREVVPGEWRAGGEQAGRAEDRAVVERDPDGDDGKGTPALRGGARARRAAPVLSGASAGRAWLIPSGKSAIASPASSAPRRRGRSGRWRRAAIRRAPPRARGDRPTQPSNWPTPRRPGRGAPGSRRSPHQPPDLGVGEERRLGEEARPTPTARATSADRAASWDGWRRRAAGGRRRRRTARRRGALEPVEERGGQGAESADEAGGEGHREGRARRRRGRGACP